MAALETVATRRAKGSIETTIEIQLYFSQLANALKNRFSLFKKADCIKIFTKITY